LALLTAYAALSACAPRQKPAKSGPGKLSKRASFDLNCPIKDLVPIDIDEKTVGIHGCGKRAVYVYVCENVRPPGWGLHMETRECRWLRQGEVMPDEPGDAQ
jgi:hypothetical protein